MNDRDKITRKGDLDYHLMLPHYSPHLCMLQSLREEPGDVMY